MQVGMIGAGRMGANLVRRLLLDGHDCVVYDVDTEAVEKLAAEGAVGTYSIAEFTAALETPRVAWIMVPAAHTEGTITELARYFQPADIIIDGGNSMWQDDVDMAVTLAKQGLHFVDIGTSGGVWGLERGYSLMIGGEAEVVSYLEPIFDTIAPGIDAAPRTQGKQGQPKPGEKGWLHCGPNGAGHFVKMVHNGIEYGMMAALSEGLGILQAADAGLPDRGASRDADAETTPLRDGKYYRYDFDTAAIAEVWRRGSVISSWLGDLTAHALSVDGDLDGFSGRVSDSGEGRWTAQAAIELGVPASTITASLYARFASQGNDLFTNKVLSAQRAEFGGHVEKVETGIGGSAASVVDDPTPTVTDDASNVPED
ncbi:MAG: phosphogluconate dehydrogenase (NAD(+)-dependent, decarboxylating) [Actinomycetota bacterium]